MNPMVVIVHNGHVVLGPMTYNKYRFENFFLDDLEMALDLPNSYSGPMTIDDNTKILPYELLPNPPYNPKIQRIDGPFWTFTDEMATGYYGISNYSVEAVRNFLKEKTEQTRWVKENVIINIPTSTGSYDFSTDKLTRATFHQYIELGLEHVNWKLSRDNWIVLNKNDINLVFNTLMHHIKDCYEWEYNIVDQIDSSTTLEQLDSIVIEVE